MLGGLVVLATNRPGATGPPQASHTPTASPSDDSSPAGPTAVPVDVSGTWSGTWTTVTPDGQTGPLSVSVTQSGVDLVATIRMDGNPCLTEGGFVGPVSGMEIELRNGQRDEIEFDGTVDGDRMTGTFSMACDNASGTWILERASSSTG